MSNQTQRESFLQELEDDYEELLCRRSLHNIADIVLTILALVSSLAATILAAAKGAVIAQIEFTEWTPDGHLRACEFCRPAP